MDYHSSSLSAAFVILICVCRYVLSIIQDVYMLENCDTTIATDSFFYHSGVLHSQRDSFYPNNVDCRITITTESDKLLLLVFEEFDIEGDVGRTCFDALLYVDGTANSSQAILANGEELCGHKSEIGNLVSNGQTVNLLLKTDHSTRADGFRLVYTSFHTGPCNESEFRCSNGRCIIAQLVNNTHDNCGDGSDEPDTDTQLEPPNNHGKFAELGIGLIIGIGVTASIGLLIIVVCTICIIYHALCSKILCNNHHSNGQEGKEDEVVAAPAPPIFRSSSRVGGVSINDRSRTTDAWM